MSTVVESYGLHRDGGVVWLVQGRKGNNFVGLRGQCPFHASGEMCNHLVSTAAPVPDRIHWESWMNIFPDPLVQAMLPIPHEPGQNIFYVPDPYDDLSLHLTTLTRLSSPIKQVIKPTWTVKVKQLERELKTSNIQPLVLVQTTTKSQALVDAIGKLALFVPRTVIIVGQPDVVVRPPIQRIETNIRQFNLADMMMLPFENLGSTIIRRHARNEELGAPWEDRATRRNRQIQERS